MTPQDIIDAVVALARSDARFVAVALVGSHARGEARPDSDIDLVLVCVDPDVALVDRSWMAGFGKRTEEEIEDYGMVKSIRVFFDEGPEVEFVVAGYFWAEPPIDPGTAGVMSAGMQILYDPEGRLARAAAFVAKHPRGSSSTAGPVSADPSSECC